MSDLFAPGSEFGQYEILGELGAGGMGRVFKARDTTLDREVAIKTLSPQLAADPDYLQRFLKEARAVARLNHQNIVQIYSFGSIENTPYIAMEFVDGVSLGARVKKARLSELETVKVGRQACRALDIAHSHGIVHRDIKPDNLILSKRGDLKLVDLGVAKRVGDDQSITQTGLMVGTPHYISPEQVRGQRDIDGRADIYSLGATLYHLVTGHTPYEGSSGAHVMSMHLFADLPDPRSYEPSVTEGFCRVLRKMMAKERDERYANVAEVDRDLHLLETGQTPEVDEPSDTALTTMVLERPTGASETSAAIFDLGLLARIEEKLAASIGPMARVVVRKAARKAQSLDQLCEELSLQVGAGVHRDEFRKKCLACAEGGTSASASGVSSGVGTALRPGVTRPAEDVSSAATHMAQVPSAAPPPDEADLARLESELARHIGPLARVLVKRAAKAGGTLAEIGARLEENIPDARARATFRAAVERLG
ncbi:MAG: serine/threonine protein kinase [Acidobacteria bacterium]|nr:serine/threonine protein kinase [Acidobacteriota bacterium]